MVDDRLVGDAAAHLPVGLLKIECEYNTTLAPNESLMQRPTAPVDDRSEAPQQALASSRTQDVALRAVTLMCLGRRAVHSLARAGMPHRP